MYENVCLIYDEFKCIGRRKAEKAILNNLEERRCSELLLQNPRTIDDITNTIEKILIGRDWALRVRANDDIYTTSFVGQIEDFINNDNHFGVKKDGNILIKVPLQARNQKGEGMKHEIHYNLTEKGIEKVRIYDFKKDGIDRIFKSVQNIYDENGIEIERKTEILRRDKESSKTEFIWRKRLEDYPHIIEESTSSQNIKGGKKVEFFNIGQSRNIMDLDKGEEKPIEEKHVEKLTEKEIKEIIGRNQSRPNYINGINTLLGIPKEEVR